MKRQWAAIILTAALALAGCSGNEAGSDTATATDPSSADTSAAAKQINTQIARLQAQLKKIDLPIDNVSPYL